MIPKGSQGIGHLVTRIAQDLIPQAPRRLRGDRPRPISPRCWAWSAQDYDRAADVLVSEHGRWLPILREAADDAGRRRR